eukprot:7995083-Alexandrium_andersonii.AAC.1
MPGAATALPPSAAAVPLFVRQRVPGILIPEVDGLPVWLSGTLPAVPAPDLVLRTTPRAPPAC